MVWTHRIIRRLLGQRQTEVKGERLDCRGDAADWLILGLRRPPGPGMVRVLVSVVPPGLEACSPFYPALKRWAEFGPPLRGAICGGSMCQATLRHSFQIKKGTYRRVNAAPPTGTEFVFWTLQSKFSPTFKFPAYCLLRSVASLQKWKRYLSCTLISRGFAKWVPPKVLLLSRR